MGLEGPGGVRGGGDLDAGIGQTFDLATGEAGKMGMGVGLAGGLGAEFKPPDMRAVVRAGQEAGVRQVHEIPIEGGPVQAGGRQGVDDFGMAPGRPGLLEVL